MHRVHHYHTWMLAFDCIAFCIYVHCYPLRSLGFVFVILHEHSAFTCNVILYSRYVLSPLSYTDIWHLHAPLSHTVATFHLRYPTRTFGIYVHRYPIRLLYFIFVILHGHCILCAPISHADATSSPLSYMDDPICVRRYSMWMLRSFSPILRRAMHFALLRIL